MSQIASLLLEGSIRGGILPLTEHSGFREVNSRNDHKGVTGVTLLRDGRSHALHWKGITYFLHLLGGI